MFSRPRHVLHLKRHVHRCSTTRSPPLYALPTRSYAPSKSGSSFCRTLYFRSILKLISHLWLTLNPLTCRIWWAPNNVSRWQMGFNSAFKGLILPSGSFLHVSPPNLRCTSPLHHVCSCPANLILWSVHPNSICWAVQTKVAFNMPFSPVSCYSTLFSPNILVRSPMCKILSIRPSFNVRGQFHNHTTQQANMYGGRSQWKGCVQN